MHDYFVLVSSVPVQQLKELNMASAKKAVRIPKRVVVPNVRIAKGMVQRVTFLHNKQKHRFVAKTRGCPIIRVDFREDDGKFHAFSGTVDVTANDSRDAFTKAVHKLWVA